MTIPNIAFCICISNCNCIIQYGINTSIKKPKERAANSINFFQNPFIPFRLDITCPVALSAIIPVTQSKTIAHATEDMINPYCFVNDRQIPAFLRCSMNFSLPFIPVQQAILVPYLLYHHWITSFLQPHFLFREPILLPLP